MIDIRAEHEALLQKLLAKQDLKYQAGSSMVMKTRLRVYGVRVPDLRKMAGAWFDAHRDSPWEVVLSLIDELWEAPSQDERALALLLLERNRRRIPNLDWAYFERWRKLLDNWGLTDGLGILVLGPWLATDFQMREKHLWDLIQDPDIWSRRLALVATVPLNRKPASRISDVTFGLVERVMRERDPMITKAVSWALREMTKTDKDRVASFTESHRKLLAPLVVREVGNKMRTGLKTPRRLNKAPASGINRIG